MSQTGSSAIPEDALVVAFDLDDTLWRTSHLYQQGAEELGSLLSDYINPKKVPELLEKFHEQNLPLNGYGADAYGMSMLDTAEHVLGEVDSRTISDIKKICERIREDSAVPLEGAQEALDVMAATGVTMIAVTKGQHSEQSRKLERSGLADKFEHLFVLKNKTADAYRTVMAAIKTPPERYIQIGDSISSDVLPVLEAGGRAIYVKPPVDCWEDRDIKLPEGVPSTTNLSEACHWVEEWVQERQAPITTDLLHPVAAATPSINRNLAKKYKKEILQMKRTRKYSNQQIGDRYGLSSSAVSRITRGMPRKVRNQRGGY